MQPKELSLLMIFDAIMTEGSITRAAERLSITQPAVSNALARMRSRWNDELFIREGKSLRPTSFATSLALQVGDPLKQLTQAITREGFDPSTAHRTFRICAVSDAVIDGAWCDLRRLIEAEAPTISLHTFPYHLEEAERILMSGEVDMIVGHALPPSRLIRSEHLFVPEHVCVMRLDHPLAQGALSLEDFAYADHLLVSNMSCDTTDVVDQALIRHGLSRHVSMTAHHHGLVPQMLQATNLIAVVPSTAIEQAIFAGQVAVFDPPLPLFPTPIACLWHKRQELDPGLRWLRGHVNRLIADHAGRHAEALERTYHPRVEKTG